MKNNEKIVPYIGFFQIQIDIPACRSVKERRQVIRSLIDKIRRRWNVSAIDLGPENRWDQAYIAFSLVGSSYGMCKDRIETIKNFIEREEDMAAFTIIHFWQEVDAYDELSNAESE